MSSSKVVKYDKSRYFWQGVTLVSKIFTASWLTDKDVDYLIFNYPDSTITPREHTRIQLLKLLKLPSDSPLNILNYEYVKESPGKIISLSHGQEAGAVIAVSKHIADGVGIDIELKKRKIHPRSKKFFVNKHDLDISSDNLLHLWVMKEAAFKAAAPRLPHLKVLNQLWVKEQQFGLVGSEQAIGEVGLTKLKAQIVAAAYLRII